MLDGGGPRADTGGIDDFADGAEGYADDLFRCLCIGFKRIGEHQIAEHRIRKLRGRPGIRPHHGQAGLAGSFTHQVSGDTLNTLGLSVFSTSRYARIHELGGVIKPVNAPWLRFKIGGQWVTTDKVTIPARLGWTEVWDANEAARAKILGGCVSEASFGLTGARA